MSFDFDSHVRYHLDALSKLVDNNESIRQAMYDSPANLPLEEVIPLRERLLEMESHVTLLRNAYAVHVEEEKKAKRRFNPFKK